MASASSFPEDLPDAEHFTATVASPERTTNGQYAWWISDEGLKAPVSIINYMRETTAPQPGNNRYLDYRPESERVLIARHDPNFDWPLLNDINRPYDDTNKSLQRIINIGQIETLMRNSNADQLLSMRSSVRHDHTVENHFVVSNPANGGLKKDLSLKTLDAKSISQDELNALYLEPNQLITREVIKLVQFRGRPAAHPSDEIIGMQIGEAEVASTEAKSNHFDLVPVILEFQISLGVASDGGNLPIHQSVASPLYLVFKVYMELWNPYTIPMLIGDATMDSKRGFSDIEVVINHLPRFSIVNKRTSESTTGSLPTVRIRWSDHHAKKLLRPGMVFRTSLPLGSKCLGSNPRRPQYWYHSIPAGLPHPRQMLRRLHG